MAFDAGMLRAVTDEIANTLCGGAKVEKICQPAKEEFDFVLHAGGVSRRLCFIAGSNVPHFSYSRKERENLPTPSMFCMLLRKHLQGGKLIACEQLGFERATRFTFTSRDELGFGVKRYLIAEMMGKYSNLILLDEEEKILSALKIVDFSASRVRQVLPGMHYTLPPKQEKGDPLLLNRSEFDALWEMYPKERTLSRFISDSYFGISSQNAREMAYRASGKEDATLSETAPEQLYGVMDEWFLALKAGQYRPTLLLDEEGEPQDYSYADLHSGGYTVYHPADFCELLDLYFGEKDKKERIRQRSLDLSRLLTRREAQLHRKLEAQRGELADCERAAEYKKAGDLITENIYRLKRGDERFVAIDYTVDPPKETPLTLDPRFSPVANAQRMYKLYAKARTAKIKLTELIKSGEEELDYIVGVKGFLERAESEADFAELRSELASAGYLAREKGKAKEKAHKARPLEYTTSNGYRLLCGRNNLQNDMLTFRIAEKDDLWFHAKGVGGSHVILVCGGGEPPAEDYTEAAALAAYYSQAGNAVTAVDYTRVRNIKKPQGARCGYVTYKTNSTAYVAPSLPKGKKDD